MHDMAGPEKAKHPDRRGKMAELAADFFTLVDDIEAASSVAEVWKSYLNAGQRVSLCYGIACYLPSLSTDKFSIVASSCPEGWLGEYETRGLSRGSLINERARTSKRSFHWRLSDWDESALSPIQREWYQNNVRYRLLGGLAVLDHAGGDDMMIILAGPDGSLENHDFKALNLAGIEAISRLHDLGLSNPASAGFSNRERECLQWVAAGKTDKDIGQILGLSEKTVNVYIERAKVKCGVHSRTQAIVVALQRGDISP
jgi:DNA-binding CsgD family transcriptional regulator